MKFLKQHCRYFRTIHYRVQIRIEKELDRTVKERDENARERDEIRKQLKAVVENLSSRGMDENEISKLTGISSDEIKKFYEYRSDFCSVIP